MPAAVRRTRQVAPVPLPNDSEAVQNEVPEVPAALQRRKPARAAARRVQAATSDAKVRLPEDKRAVEVADGELRVPVAGRYFRVAEAVGIMPLMEWASALDTVDTRNISELASRFRLLKAIVHPEEWDEFRAHTTEAKCNGDVLMAFQNAAIEAMAARPTGAPAAS
jgi:hypothetical protein